jgi:phosphonoacetate hydrolase
VASVVIFVFDGLQAELVTPELMPRLSSFTAEGVRLERHQPVFPTVTRVNASSIVTGCFPGTHGLPGNRSWIPEYHPTETMNAMRPEFLELRERAGRVLLVPTLAELLAAHGRDYIAVGIGSTGQSFVHHPNGDDATHGATVHPEYALPSHHSEALFNRFGRWPDQALPNTARIERLIDVATHLIEQRDPAVTLLWCSEPDGSQHASPLNSPRVHDAVRAADAGFGRLLDNLEASGRSEDTSVIVTCDHGHSTVDALVPVEALLAEAGFAPPGAPGGVIAADNGGAVLLYVPDRELAVVDRLATYLMAQHWAGPILTAADRYGAVEGTHPTALVGLEGPRGPDLAVSFSWEDRPNEHGQPGYVYASGGKPGQGQHGSMSPRELRTFTAARGPAFRSAEAVSATTGHPDLAPTVLRILGLDPPPHMDGRVITEALAAATSDAAPPAEEHTATRTLEGGAYTQRLLVAPTTRAAHLVEASSEFVED